MSENVYKTYAQLLKWHKKGHALWEPIQTHRIPLGSVGYFDEKGRWETVLPHVTAAPTPWQFNKTINIVDESTDTAREFRSKNFENVDIKLKLGLE